MQYEHEPQGDEHDTSTARRLGGTHGFRRHLRIPTGPAFGDAMNPPAQLLPDQPAGRRPDAPAWVLMNRAPR